MCAIESPSNRVGPLVRGEWCWRLSWRGQMSIATCVVAPGLIAVAAAGRAEGVPSTVTVASASDIPGITQSGQDPALPASIDYAHASGWYIGAWGSNVDFCATGAA